MRGHGVDGKKARGVGKKIETGTEFPTVCSSSKNLLTSIPIKKFLHNMSRKAGDQPWINTPSIRKSPISYKVDGDVLVIQRNTKAPLKVSMGEEEEAIGQLVNELDKLTETREKRSLSAYERGLYSYITRTLGYIYPLLDKKKWDRVAKGLEDFKSREENGFEHDEDGRAKWRTYQEGGLVLFLEEIPGAESVSAKTKEATHLAIEVAMYQKIEPKTLLVTRATAMLAKARQKQAGECPTS